MQTDVRNLLLSMKEKIEQQEVVDISQITSEPVYNKKVFKPSYIVTAVQLPTGAIELATNTEHIAEKIDYILNAYDEEMRLKTNTDIKMLDVMIV